MKVKEILIILIGILSLIILYKIINGGLVEGAEENCQVGDHVICKDNSQCAGKQCCKDGSICPSANNDDLPNCRVSKKHFDCTTSTPPPPTPPPPTPPPPTPPPPTPPPPTPPPPTPPPPTPPPPNTDCINVNNDCNTCNNNRCVTSECRFNVPGNNCAKLNPDQCNTNNYWGKYQGANVKCLHGIFGCTGATFPKRLCDGVCQCEKVIDTNNNR